MATGTTVVLGAGAVGTASAWYLLKAGHRVEVVERQPAAGLETSWGNGGVIHASEVGALVAARHAAQDPGLARQGERAAPAALRRHSADVALGAGLRRELHAERFRANTLANLALALHSLRSLQEIGAEDGRRL